MPYQSKAQMRLMHAKHPKIAAEWDKKYPAPKNLPERASKSDAYKRAAERYA